MDDTSAHQKMTCRVKWFDSLKGFGFIIPEDGGPDILLHANVLRKLGRNTVADGVRLDVTATQINGRWQATSIVTILAEPASNRPKLAQFDALDPEALQALPYQPDRVKWFDMVKGIGFANIFGLSDDVFIHIEVLRAAGLAGLQPGEAIVLRTVEGERGLLAVEVADWYQQRF